MTMSVIAYAIDASGERFAKVDIVVARKDDCLPSPVMEGTADINL
jgi:hypothetical protein